MSNEKVFRHEKRDEPDDGMRVWYRAYKIEYKSPLWTVYTRKGKFLFSGNHLDGCKQWIDVFMYGQVR